MYKTTGSKGKQRNVVNSQANNVCMLS